MLQWTFNINSWIFCDSVLFYGFKKRFQCQGSLETGSNKVQVSLLYRLYYANVHGASQKGRLLHAVFLILWSIFMIMF